MKWVVVDTLSYCVGIDVKGGVIVHAPPILTWAKGKRAARLLKNYLTRRGILRKWKEFSDEVEKEERQ